MRESDCGGRCGIGPGVRVSQPPDRALKPWWEVVGLGLASERAPRDHWHRHEANVGNLGVAEPAEGCEGTGPVTCLLGFKSVYLLWKLFLKIKCYIFEGSPEQFKKQKCTLSDGQPQGRAPRNEEQTGRGSAGWARPTDRKVEGSGPRWGVCGKQQRGVSFSRGGFSPSLPPSLPLSLKSIKDKK